MATPKKSCKKRTNSFKENVYKIVRGIPEGRVATYAYVACRLGNPHAYRAVGNALNQNRSCDVPCHRVIRSDKTIGGYAWGSERKKSLLRKEGVKFFGDTVDEFFLYN